MSLKKIGLASREAPGHSPEPWEDAVQWLKAAGLKNSQGRAAVIEAFFAQTGQVTAEEVAARVRERTDGVSVSTVYRTLKVLVEHGLASARQFGKGQARFKPAVRGPHLDRLVCTRCRVVVELIENGIGELQASAARRHGFEIHSRRSEVFGVCPRCRRLRDAATRPDSELV